MGNLRLPTRWFYLFVIQLSTIYFSIAQSMVLDSFIKVKTLGDVSVDLVPGDEYKATYTILKGFERDLSFEHKEGLLIIRIKPPAGSKYNRLITKAKVTLYYKDVRDIEIGAMSEVKSLDTLKTSFLKIKSFKGGRGQFTLNVFDLKLETSQQGSLYLKGKTQTLKVESLSNSVVEAQNLEVREADVIAEKNSRVTFRCDRAVYGKSSTGATIVCYGNPTYKNIDDRGGGKFEVKE